VELAPFSRDAEVSKEVPYGIPAQTENLTSKQGGFAGPLNMIQSWHIRMLL
jgi:hypothetical protein